MNDGVAMGLAQLDFGRSYVILYWNRDHHSPTLLPTKGFEPASERAMPSQQASRYDSISTLRRSYVVPPSTDPWPVEARSSL